MKTIYVFVYGILKTEDGQPATLCDPNWEMRNLGSFPALIYRPGNETAAIKGQLLTVDEDELAHFDMIEGYPNFYTRCRVNVDVEGEVYRAWMYYLEEMDSWIREAPIVKEGEWYRDYC